MGGQGIGARRQAGQGCATASPHSRFPQKRLPPEPAARPGGATQLARLDRLQPLASTPATTRPAGPT